MSEDLKYTVIAEDCPDYPTPNQTVIHTDKFRLRRLARGRKT